MRVLTFLHSCELGGVERIALRLVREWRAAGHDAPLVMGREDGAMREKARDLDVTVLASGRIDTSWWETLWMIWRLPSAIRRLRPDVLFCAGNSYAIVAAAMKLRLGRACPPVVIKISNDLVRRDLPAPVRFGYHRWLRLQGRLFDRFVAIAEPMRAEIAQYCHVALDRVSVVNDPALDALPTPQKPRQEADGRRFVSVGRLSSQKRYNLLLVAFAKIAHPRDLLTIYGEGGERRALERQAAALGIADRVVLAGFVQDAAALIGRHDVFVLSSDYEGMPAVVVEALAAGVAIVATDCSVSMRHLLDDGALGAVVPTGDVSLLAAAMDAVPRPDIAAQRSRAMQFTLAAAAPAWWALFEQAASGRRLSR